MARSKAGTRPQVRSGIQKTQGMSRVALPSDFPFGKEKVDMLAPSTGVYGPLVSGTRPINAVKLRKGR